MVRLPVYRESAEVGLQVQRERKVLTHHMLWNCVLGRPAIGAAQAENFPVLVRRSGAMPYGAKPQLPRPRQADPARAPPSTRAYRTDQISFARGPIKEPIPRWARPTKAPRQPYRLPSYRQVHSSAARTHTRSRLRCWRGPDWPELEVLRVINGRPRTAAHDKESAGVPQRRQPEA